MGQLVLFLANEALDSLINAVKLGDKDAESRAAMQLACLASLASIIEAAIAESTGGEE